MDNKVYNPKTKRHIKVGGPAFKGLIQEGYIYDDDTNTILPPGNTSIVKPPSLTIKIPQSKPTVKPPAKLTKTQFTALLPSDTEVKIKDAKDRLIPDMTINNIVHVSDIHIPINLHNKRHDEYNHVFNNLYKRLKSMDLATTLIIITGDLLHTKLKLEAETIQLARDFLYNLSQLAHTAIIIGNHDFTEHNLQRTDTLSAVTDRLPVYVLKYTGIYQFGTIQLVFNSLYDNKFIRRNDVPATNMPVYALFHGTVVGCTSDSGLVLNESLTKQYPHLNDFYGYDAVLLGHIHKQQFLRPNIAYAGSLIQQNFGEQPSGHGILIWNTSNHTAEAINIDNMYVHLNLTIADGQLTSASLDLLGFHKHQNLYIKCHCTNTTQEQADNIYRQLIASNYTIETYILSKQQRTLTIEHQLHDTASFLTLDQEIKLINDNAKPQLVDKVVDLHKKYYTQVQSNTGHWYPTQLSWKNIGIYGNDINNHIDFQSGIIDICSRNMTGKSTIVNIILFALFHKTTTHKSSAAILNKYSTKGFVELDFIHNGSHYKIQKYIKLMQRSARNSATEIFETNFYKIDKNSLSPLNGATQTQTLHIIQDYIGTLEQFLDGNLISTRSDVAPILSKTPAELLKHFHKICNTAHYENYIKQCTEDAKKIKCQLTKLRNNNEYIQTLLKSDENNDSIQNNINAVNLQLTELQDKKTSLNTQRDNILIDMAKLNRLATPTDMSESMLQSEINKLESITFADDIAESAADYLVEDDIDNEIDDLQNTMHTDLPSIEYIQENIIAIELQLQDIYNNKPEQDSSSLYISKGKLQSDINTLLEKTSKIKLALDKIDSFSTQKLPTDFNIDDTSQQLTETKLKIRDITAVLPPNITEEETKQQLAKLPHIDDSHNLDELNLLLKQEEQKFAAFNKPCTQTNYSKEELQQQFKTIVPVPKKRDQPSDLSQQLISLDSQRKLLLTKNTVRKRDTWYISYIKDNTLNGIPLDIFKQYYNDTDRLEFNRIESLYHDLIDLQKHNDEADLIVQQNLQIQQHNIQVQNQINWIEKQSISQRINFLKTSIQFKYLTDTINNFSTLRKLQSNLEHLTDLLNFHSFATYNQDLTDINLLIQEKQQQLIHVDNNINWWNTYNNLIEDKNKYNDDTIKIGDNISKENRINRLITVRDYISTNNKIAALVRQKQELVNHNTYIQKEQILENIETDINTVNTDIAKYNEQINHYTHLLKSTTELQNNKDELDTLELQYSVYEEYKMLFDRKAIPALILKQKLQSFIEQTNQIFSDCTKYKLDYSITDKDKLDFTIIDTVTNAALEPHRLSGYETVALQIAMNKASIDIAATHKTSLFIVDESLDCIDQERFPSVIVELCNIIKQHFVVTILISHRDIPSHTVDQHIKITHSNNCSYIEH